MRYKRLTGITEEELHRHFPWIAADDNVKKIHNTND